MQLVWKKGMILYPINPQCRWFIIQNRPLWAGWAFHGSCGGGSGQTFPRGVLVWSSGAGRRGTKAQYVGLSPESRALWMDAAWVFWDYCRCPGDREACAQLRCCPPPFCWGATLMRRLVCWSTPPLHSHTLIRVGRGGVQWSRERGISFITSFSVSRGGQEPSKEEFKQCQGYFFKSWFT